MGNWTPGPWKAREINPKDAAWGACEIWPKSGGRPVATMVCGTANARLIAAAPMLLEEFQNANVQMDMAAECIEAGRYDEALLHVRAMKRKRTAIIAAATGETE